MEHVGIDVHSNESQICMLTEEGEILERRIRTRSERFAELRLELPWRMPVQLTVCDIAGRLRATLLDEELPGGVTDAIWDGRDDGGALVASGMYFVRLRYAGGARVSKVVMVR